MVCFQTVVLLACHNADASSTFNLCHFLFIFTLAFRELQITHDFQQHLIVCLAPHQHGTKQGEDIIMSPAVLGRPLGRGYS